MFQLLFSLKLLLTIWIINVSGELYSIKNAADLQTRLQMFDSTHASQSTVVVYVNEDVNIWLNLQPNGQNSIYIQEMDVECVMKYAKESEETIKCENRELTKKTILMNITDSENLSTKISTTTTESTHITPTSKQPEAGPVPVTSLLPTVSTVVTTKIPDSQQSITTPQPVPSRLSTVSNVVTTKIPDVQPSITTTQPVPSGLPTVEKDVTTKFPDSQQSITTPQPVPSRWSTVSKAVTTKIPDVQPSITTTQPVPSRLPTVDKNVTTKFPDSQQSITTPQPVPSGFPTVSKAVTTKIPDVNPGNVYQEYYLLYKLITYHWVIFNSVSIILNPNISQYFWYWFPNGLLVWYQHPNYYPVLLKLIWEKFYIYYRTNISKYFGKYIIWRLGYINKFQYYKYVVCPQLQYYLGQPMEKLPMSVQKWLKHYFQPNGQRPKWVQQLLQLCIPQRQWMIYKLFTFLKFRKNINSNFINTLYNKYSQLNKGKEILSYTNYSRPIHQIYYKKEYVSTPQI